jgi:hypothetical protein
MAVTVAACSPALTREQAQERAIAAFSEPGVHEGPVQDVMVLETTETTRTGYRGWDFRLSGLVVLPGLPDGMLVTKTLFVTADDGAVSIVGQG